MSDYSLRLELTAKDHRISALEAKLEEAEKYPLSLTIAKETYFKEWQKCEKKLKIALAETTGRRG